MNPAEGGYGGFVLLGVLVVLSIAGWVLAKKYREEYGTTEMSRFRGFGLLFGLMVVAVGTAMICGYTSEPREEAMWEYMMYCGLTIAGGTLLSVVCCMGILRRYSGKAAAAMILRLLVVGFATYMVAAWISVALFMWMFAKLLPRKKYVVVEVD